MFRATICTCKCRYHPNDLQFLLPSFLVRERGAFLFPTLLWPRRNLHHDLWINNSTLLLWVHVRIITLLANDLSSTSLVLLHRCDDDHLLLPIRHVKIVAQCYSIPRRGLLNCSRNCPLELLHGRLIREGVPDVALANRRHPLRYRGHHIRT